MKIPIIVGTTVSALALTVSVSLANLNTINLLLSGSDAATSPMSAFNVNGNDEDETYNPNKKDGGNLGEYLQSGLSGGGGGTGGLNLLWILQNAKDPDKESYAYQLLEVYSNLQHGKYNNYEYHIAPEAIAGSHKNETGLTSFVTPKVSGYGKVTSGILGQTINGKVITLENAMKEDIIGHAEKSGSVWADKDSNGGDGCPDGPFQVIQCNQSDTNANKQRGDGKYDLYNFVDAANVKDMKYNTIATSYAETGSTPDARALMMLSALDHNRGSSGVGWNLFGFPYDVSTSKSGGASKYLKHSTIASMTPDQLEVAAMFPKDLLRWFDAANIPLELMMTGDNATGQGTGLLLVLANGGFIDIPLQKTAANNVKGLDNGIIEKIFPGQTNKTIVDYVNNNFIKQPWDVLEMSKSEYDKIYGSGPYTNYEEGYSTPEGLYRNTAFYIDKSVKSDNYKAGENIVVRAVEGIALGYLLDVGVIGVHTIIQIALEAGIKSLTDGTVVDPSNPQTLYEKIAPESSGKFNPAQAESGNFGKFLDALALTGTLTELQQAQVKAMYEISGGYYYQNPLRGTMSPTGVIYTDCSYYASVGLHLGKVVTDPYPITSDIGNGVWITSKQKTNPVNGTEYPATVVQLDKSGNLMKGNTKSDKTQHMHDKSWPDKLIAGDMLVTKEKGHIMTYVGQNNTGKDMVLPPDISRVNAERSTVKAGEHFFMHAMGRNGNTTNLMGLTPHISPYRDQTKAQHIAFRPTYNIR